MTTSKKYLVSRQSQNQLQIMLFSDLDMQMSAQRADERSGARTPSPLDTYLSTPFHARSVSFCAASILSLCVCAFLMH